MRVLILSAAMAAMLPAFALAQDTPWVLSPDGIGPLKIGVDDSTMERHLHTRLGYNRYKDRGCSTLITKELAPTGLSYTIESKYLTRINLDFYSNDPRPLAIKTDTGLGLGSSEEDVLKAYPDAQVKPNELDPTWHTIIALSPSRTKGIVFETNGKTVKSIRAGLTPTIYPPNPCN